MSQFKDLRKAAFAVGFGVTMGKFAGEIVKAAISGVGLGVLKAAADDGNELAQKVCEKNGIEIDSKEDLNNKETNKIIGFHA